MPNTPQDEGQAHIPENGVQKPHEDRPVSHFDKKRTGGHSPHARGHSPHTGTPHHIKPRSDQPRVEGHKPAHTGQKPA
jgi:hypothetical protein